ncbi:MAG: amino acid--tRNA ligase-related protein, partial [bacterium]|nr:amino acid--tRNA ligase-related protein [bacterium]
MQLFLKKDEIGEEAFTLFIDTIDIGDFVEATGVPMRTKSGQESLLVSDWRILSKTLRPIPDEWYGFSDEDERFRRRYLDMLLNKEVLENAKKRSVFWNAFRTYLLSREFVEVETPVLENTTGGAEARPFITHHNALNIDVYLRISAGELWQKMLLVGGLPKTFEIGRIFRNEGMSREHLQDYTQLEFYQAYSDYEEGMRMVTDMYRFVAQETFGTLKFTIGEHKVDLGKDWEVYDFCEVIKKEYGINPLTVTLEEVKAALKKAGIEKDADSMSIGRGVDLLWKRIRKGIAGPGFLIGVPVYLEPLAKRSEKNDKVVERFQIILA